MPELRKGKYYATEEEIRQAAADFEQAFPIMTERAKATVAETISRIREYFSTHELPDRKKNEQLFNENQPVFMILDADPEILEVSGPEDQKFVETMMQIFRENYAEDYLESNMLGDRLHKMQSKGISKTDGNIFLSEARNFGTLLEQQEEAAKFILERKSDLIEKREKGVYSENEAMDRERALRMMQDMMSKSAQLYEQHNYMGAHGWFVTAEKYKDRLIAATSPETYAKFQKRELPLVQAIGYENSQYSRVMAKFREALEKEHFDFQQLENSLEYYNHVVYGKVVKEDNARQAEHVQMSNHVDADSKVLGGTLAEVDLEGSLREVQAGLNVQQFGHKDTPEMRQLKESAEALKELVRNFNQKVLTDPAYAGKMQTSLDKALTDARAYLSAKDADGKALADRTKMGQARYRAAQALVEKIQRTQETLQWKKEETALKQDCEKAKDPKYRELMEQQLQSKQNLYELAQKNEWTMEERQTILSEVALMTARQRLEGEYRLHGNTDGPMWTLEKKRGDVVTQMAENFEVDNVVRGFVDGLDRGKLMAFVSGKGEQALSKSQAMGYMVSEPSAAPENKAAEKVNAAEAAQEKAAEKKGPVL